MASLLMGEPPYRPPPRSSISKRGDRRRGRLPAATSSVTVGPFLERNEGRSPEVSIREPISPRKRFNDTRRSAGSLHRPMTEPGLAVCRSLPAISVKKIVAPQPAKTRKRVVSDEPPGDDTFACVINRELYSDIFD